MAATVVGLVALGALALGALAGPATSLWLEIPFAGGRGAPPDTAPPLPLPAGDPPMVRLAVAGDVGTGDEHAHRTAAVMDDQERASDYHALLLLGDNVYPDGDPDGLPRTVFEPFADVLDGGTELLAVLGNHDVRDGNGPAHRTAIGMPARWYATRYRNVLIVALDSTRADDPDQLAWLEETLATNHADGTVDWTIAMLHHPPYSAGAHGSSHDVRRAFSPLFERFGVQLVLAGHDHDYQRSRPIDGVTYVVSGGAAKLRRTGTADFTEVAWSTHHFLDIAAWDDRLLIRPIDHAGEQFDEALLTR